MEISFEFYRFIEKLFMVLWSYDLINNLDQKRKIKKWLKYVVFVFKKFILRAALYKNHFFISVWEYVYAYWACTAGRKTV